MLQSVRCAVLSVGLCGLNRFINQFSKLEQQIEPQILLGMVAKET
jgi:hypothetical protein